MPEINTRGEVLNFNGQDYHFRVEFDNGDRKITLNSRAMTELNISESFVDWFTSGWIIIDNAYDHFERLPDFGDHPTAPEIDLDYKYRGDGRDIIRIEIMPKLDDVGDTELPALDLKPEVWEIFLEGILYDVEELPGYTVESKQKRFYFWEKEYHLMLEKNVEFTTANVGANLGKAAHNLSNDGRALRTGEALFELFKSVPELYQKTPSKVGEKENWAAGDEKNTIHYTSPANYKLIDDVNDLLMAHTNSKEDDYDLCFLKFNRRTKDGGGMLPKIFTFESLSSFFNKAGIEKAGEYQTEVFTLMDLNEGEGNVIPIAKTPTKSEIIGETNIRAIHKNEIPKYQFTEMSGLDSSELLAIFPVHTYNQNNGQFNIHVAENNPAAAKEYQSNQYTRKVGPDSHPRMQLNTWKTDGTNLKNVIGTGTKEARYAFGRNKILKSCLLNGAAITFEARGSTSRQAGRFMSIRKEKYNDNDFDDRLEGQYLMMGVTHHFNFKAQDYNNTIVGTKLHRHRKEPVPERPKTDSELMA